jgi:hypothetical protein
MKTVDKQKIIKDIMKKCEKHELSIMINFVIDINKKGYVATSDPDRIDTVITPKFHDGIIYQCSFPCAKLSLWKKLVHSMRTLSVFVYERK